MNTDLFPPRRALLSVSDKHGLVPLARALHDRKVELIATGGTAETLRREKNLPVKDVSEVTGFPELMDGRLKTLHPLIHGALLGQRDNPGHRQSMKEHEIQPIDLLVVNLYPFEETLAKTSDAATLIENIDIGGPAMIRAAAKNHAHVCVLTSPKDYGPFLDQLRTHNGATTGALRKRLAAQAYRRTAAYDAAIGKWMAKPQEQPLEDRSDIRSAGKMESKFAAMIEEIRQSFSHREIFEISRRLANISAPAEQNQMLAQNRAVNLVTATGFAEASDALQPDSTNTQSSALQRPAAE